MILFTRPDLCCKVVSGTEIVTSQVSLKVCRRLRYIRNTSTILIAQKNDDLLDTLVCILELHNH